jgi:hypothetical protein
VQIAHYYLSLLAAMGALMCVPSEPAPKGDKSRESDQAYRPSDLSFKRARARAVPDKSIASATPKTLALDAGTPPRESPLITKPYVEHFDAPKLSADWNITSPAWRLDDGRLCARAARNHPAWLMRRLPRNARITFTAESDSESGDLKVEAWGDGRSGATSISYTNATSYLFILGGWKNQLHVLARLDEHGRDRLERRINPSSTDQRDQRVVPGTKYHFQIERSDGRTLSWLVNGVEMHRLVDPDPLFGPGHDHLGFNDWDVRACFDDLSIIPLPN